MNQFEQWFDQDLTQQITVRHRESIMFSADNNATIVGVRLYNGGEPATPGSSCACTVIRSDGGTVSFAGTVSGNAVSAVLPQAALVIPGPIAVMLQTTDGTSTMTVLKAVFTCEPSTTGTIIDPGTIIPSVTDLIADIEAAVGSIPADYSELLAAIAPTFSSSTAYAAGAYVWYGGNLYRFTSAHAAGSWTGTDAAAVALASDVSDLKNAITQAPKLRESVEENIDLDVSDPSGNVIMRLDHGNIETKNFKSKNQTTTAASDSTADFEISDINGNVLMRMKNGNVRTKNFLSEYIRQLTGKKWTCIGDSLTEHNIRATKNYHDYIAKETGISVVNLGHSGMGYAKVGGNGKNFLSTVPSIPSDSDVITVFGSGNDLSAGLSLGTITDTTNETLCGCINLVFDAIFDAYPLIPLGVITSTPWINKEPSDGETNFSNYCAAIVEICARRGIPCLDLYHCSNLHPDNAAFRELAYSRDDGDGVHPDETGQKIIAPRFRQFLFTLI